MAALMVDCLDTKVRVYDLWLLGCYLHPFLREFQRTPDLRKRAEYRQRAEIFARQFLSESMPTRDHSEASTGHPIQMASL